MPATLYDFPDAYNSPLGFGSRPGFGISFGNLAATLDTWFEFNNGGAFGPSGSFGVGFSNLVGQFFNCSGVSRVGTGIITPGDGDFDDGAHTLGNSGFAGSRYNAAQAEGNTGEVQATAICYDADINPSGAGGGQHGPTQALFLGNRCQTKAGQFNLNSATGNQSVSGLGFSDRGAGTAPDFVMLIGGAPVLGGENGTTMMLGVFDSSSQWVTAFRSIRFSGPAGAGGLSPGHIARMSRFRTDACLLHIGAEAYGEPTTVNQLASFVSMDSNGFTINLTQAGLDSSSHVSVVAYLAVKIDPGHGQIKVGNGVQSDATVAAGFAPNAILFASNQASSTAQTTHAFCVLGATDGSTQRASWSGGGSETSATHTVLSEGQGYLSSTGVMRFALPNAVLKAEASATLTGTGANLTWGTNDAAGRLFGWVALKIDTLGAPLVITQPAVGLSQTSVKLVGTITPNTITGHTVNYRFDYGPTVSYGTSTAVLPAGDGEAPITVNAVLTGLSIGTYHYRVVAIDSVTGCVTYGADATFTIPLMVANPFVKIHFDF